MSDVPLKRHPPGHVAAVIRRAVQFAASLFLAWYFFRVLGQSLLNLPDYLQPDALWDTVNQFGGNAP